MFDQIQPSRAHGGSQVAHAHLTCKYDDFIPLCGNRVPDHAPTACFANTSDRDGPPTARTLRQLQLRLFAYHTFFVIALAPTPEQDDSPNPLFCRE